MERRASISECGFYRDSLIRVWNDALPMCSFGMANPSKGDHRIDDPTLRKCIGFASRLGFGGFYAWNICTFRATDIKELAYARDPIGPNANTAIIDGLLFGQKHFAAWGNKSKFPKEIRPRILDVLEMCAYAGHDLHCIGKTKSGDPRHPLMTSYDTPVTIYSRAYG